MVVIERTTKAHVKCTFSILIAAAVTLLIPTRGVASSYDVASMSIAERSAMEREIDVIANQVANRKAYFESDHKPIHLKSAFDVVSNMLIVHADERLGPESGYPEMEQLRRDVQDAVWPFLEQINGFGGLEWRYGGKDLYFWFPGDRTQSSPKPANHASRVAPHVLIGPGHGYYYHHGYKDWRPQRAVFNGILEDEITTMYSAVLYAELLFHDVSTELIRNDKFENHIPSGQPYGMIAARYQIQDSLPDRPDIWHSLPDSTHNQREYHEDIRSRPLYANEVGAGALIHLHTNASDNVLVRGTKVFFQTGRAESSRLGSMILCYMAEAIHGSERYHDFPVDRSPISGDYGENRLATMPSVIVEIGFHTNAEDAEALKDYEFMGKSMAGLAKGYRLFNDGQTCEPFALEVPANAEAVVDGYANIAVRSHGFPEFPVSVKGVRKDCGDDCVVSSSTAETAEELASLSLSYRCRKEDEGLPFALAITGKDIAGVTSEPQDVVVFCTAKPVP